jgi:hypothetical protein
MAALTATGLVAAIVLQTFVIVGGVTPTAIPGIVLSCPEIDYVCVGEGERVELVRSAGATPFQAGSRVVRHWIRIPLTAPGDLEGILPLLRRSYEAARDSPDPHASAGG